jgi:hypothetical protein
VYFLYAELLVLIAGSFLVGCASTRLAVRLLVRRTEADPSDSPDDFVVAPGADA